MIMVIGNPETFAIETDIDEQMLQQTGSPVGAFRYVVGNQCFGKKGHDATNVDSNYLAVEQRLGRRLTANRFLSIDSQLLLKLCYDRVFCRIASDYSSSEHFGRVSRSYARFILAPDESSAFDDGSFVVTFDANDHVRIVGTHLFSVAANPLWGAMDPDWKYRNSAACIASANADVIVHAEYFYSTLRSWIEWADNSFMWRTRKV